MKRTLLLLMTLSLATYSAQAVNAGNRLIKYTKQIDKNGRLVHEGDTVKIRGIVQSVNIPSTLNRSYFFSIYDSTSAITINMGSTRGGGKNGYNYTYVPAIGDSIFLTATVNMYLVAAGFGVFDSTGFATLTPIAAKGFDITLLKSGNTPHPAIIVNKPKEKDESDLVELDSFLLVNPSQWAVPTRGNFANVQIRSANDTTRKYVLHVPADVLGNKAPYGTFNVKGIVYQQDNTAPYTGNYSLIPRTYADITIIVAPNIPIHNIADVNHENSNGVADSAGKLVRIKGIVQSTNLFPPLYGNGLLFSIFDKTGSIIILNYQSNMGYTPTIGDSFFVEGTIAQITNTAPGFPPKQINTGWTYISPDSIALPSFANNQPLKAPIITTSFNDSMESKLIKINHVKLADTTQWDTTGRTFFGFYIPKYFMYVDLVDDNNNYTRACISRIDSFFSMPKPIDYFNITGIEGQDTISPLAFAIWPRFVRDIQLISPVLKYYKISQVKGNDGNGVSTSINTRGYLKGVVHSENLITNQLKFSLVDNSGAITVYSPKLFAAYSPMRGDSITVYGKIQQVNGLTVMAPDSIVKINAGNSLVNTYIVSLFIEADESYPRRLNHVKLVSPTQWNPGASTGTNGFSITVKDTASSDTFSIFISSGTTAFSMPVPLNGFNVSGILQQSDPSNPFNSGYYLVPRDSQDFWMLGRGVEGIENSSISEVPVSIYPNPANENLHLQFGDTKGESIFLKLYASTGMLLYSDKVNNATDLNTSQLPKGMYILQLNTNSGLQSSHKFIKE